MNNLKLALLFTKINSNRILSDSTETLYYGSRITNPDQGIHYTFLKSPNGDIGLLRTENTDKVLEDVSNLIEVCVEEEKTNPIKLTFLLKWNEADYVTTWGDTITNEFLLDFNENLNSYKLTVPTYLIDGQKRNLTPFLNDDTIALSFKVTEGRDLLYLKEAIPELIRRIYNEELTNIDNIEVLLKDTFLEIDLLKANDSRQDNEVIKASVIALRSQAIRQNIETWLDANNHIFQNRCYKYTLDLKSYSASTRCYILLESRNVIDDPIINSEIKTENGMMYIKHSTKGYPIESQIRYANQNCLESAEQISDHTFIAYGTQTVTIYASTPNLMLRVVRTANLNPNQYMQKHDTLVHEYISNNGLIFKHNNSYYTFTISGTPAKEIEVGKLRDYIWRMATKSGWGAGWGISNTEALKQNRDIGDACNTRTVIPLNISIDELKTYESLDVYIDDYYAVASNGGAGGIQSYADATGRLCYQGYAVYANNEASIPTSKLNIPLIMDNIGQAQSAHLKMQINLQTFKWDGSWNLIYNAPTGVHGLSVSQTRRKGRLLGGYNFRYYLRIIDNSQLELLCEYRQNADGDDGDNCYTQGAARMGVYLYGKKSNSMKINIIDYFTKQIAYSYAATDVKTSTPALQIIDIENEYKAYLALGDTNNSGFNIYDTNTNKTYYAKEVVMNTLKSNYDSLMISNYEESLNMIPLSSKKFSISGTVYISKAQKYQFIKDNSIYVDKVYYSTSEEKYYIYDEEAQEYHEIDYEDYIKENDVPLQIISAENDNFNFTPFTPINVTPRGLYKVAPINISIQGTISEVYEDLFKNPITFQTDIFEENQIIQILINDTIQLEFILKDGVLHSYYHTLDNTKYIISANYDITEVNE